MSHVGLKSLGSWVCAVSVFAGCARTTSSAAPRPAASPLDAIHVGATLPLTGAEASSAAFFREGYELAFEEAQKAGGLLIGGRRVPVSLDLRDDGNSPDQAAALADELVRTGHVDALLGTFSSPLVLAQAPVAERLEVPYVNTSGAARDIYQRPHRWLFGVLSSVDLLAYSVMRWIDEQQAAGHLPKPLRIAVVWERTGHGKDFRQGVLDFASRGPTRKTNYELVADEPFQLNQKEFKPLLSRVAAAKADVFLADAHLPDFIAMHRQYLALGLCHAVVSYGARGSEKQAAEVLGREGVDHVVSGVWWNSQLGERAEESRQFVALFQAKYGRKPQWYQAVSYEGARALFTAIQQAGGTEREAVREKLLHLSMNSILPGGRLRFEDEQRARAPFVVQQNMPDGTSPIVYPNDLAAQPGVAPNPACSRLHIAHSP